MTSQHINEVDVTWQGSRSAKSPSSDNGDDACPLVLWPAAWQAGRPHLPPTGFPERCPSVPKDDVSMRSSAGPPVGGKECADSSD
jgi:hypothetical protein